MSDTREWPRIAVVGAGAVGGYFGGMFARAGAPIVFIGRKHFADAVNSKGLVLDKLHGQERIRATATVEMSAVRDCSLILFCVKANDTSATATQMAPFVRPDATVVCLQNGVAVLFPVIQRRFSRISLNPAKSAWRLVTV